MPRLAPLLALVLGAGAFGLLFAGWLARWVLAKDAGPASMRRISDAVKEGAEAFLRRQNRTIAPMAALLGAALFVGYGFVRAHRAWDPVPSRLELAFWIALSFGLGAVCSLLASWVGMWVSIRSNVRTASAARTSLNDALRIALRGGAVSGLFVVAMSLLGVAGLYALANAVGGAPPTKIPLLIVGYGFGASFVALFAQLGGGIYTKAADVGADLVGKVEAGIPEDDPRNPAVIADLVGDNVGDCAGRGADLFESTAAENIGAMILGATLAEAASRANVTFSAGIVGVMLFPLVARAFGIVACVVAILTVKMRGPDDRDPMRVLDRGFYVAAALSTAGFAAACFWLLRSAAAPDAWWHFLLCGVFGVLASIAFAFITQYYTDSRYRPVKSIAEASTMGAATNVIAGISVGLECVWMPILVVGAALLGSYVVGETSGLPHAGFFGTAVATMGMLATAAYVLAMDTFGPITDNAGGVVEMSGQPDSVRATTDRLDAVGNTTKALTKGYAVGSAGLAAYLLFQAYMSEVMQYAHLGPEHAFDVDLAKPVVFVGALVGAALVFVFSAWAIRAVGKAAQAIIAEVRNQYAALPRVHDVIQFPADFAPRYGACVDIVTRAALRQMVGPGLLVVLTPIGLGLVFKWLFVSDSAPLVAAEGVAGLLMVGTIVGIVTALFFNDGGGAWDNAKKYIESGALGGKYVVAPDGTRTRNPTHSAAVVGDTLGDPFKDTAGPSLHVLVKLLSTVTLVLAPLFL